MEQQSNNTNQQLAGQGMPSEVRETIAMGLELLATDIKLYPNGYFNTIHARLAAAKAWLNTQQPLVAGMPQPDSPQGAQED